MRRVMWRRCFLRVLRCVTAAANSGRTIFLLMIWVGCCSWETRSLDRVFIAGGAACLVAANVLDLVELAGGPLGGGLGGGPVVLRFLLILALAIIWVIVVGVVAGSWTPASLFIALVVC